MREHIREILYEISNSTMDRPDYVYPRYELEIDDGDSIKVINVDLYIETSDEVPDTFDAPGSPAEAWVYKVVDSVTKEEVPEEELPQRFRDLLNDPNFAGELLDELFEGDGFEDYDGIDY